MNFGISMIVCFYGGKFGVDDICVIIFVWSNVNIVVFNEIYGFFIKYVNIR